MPSLRESSTTIHQHNYHHHHQDPLKSWKFLINFTQNLKTTEAILSSLKTILAIFTLLSVFLLLFCISSSQTRLFAKISRHHHQTPYPVEEPTNASHILFGIAGSAGTWNTRRHYNDVWWVPNVTRGYVWMDEPPAAPWPDTSPPFRVSADTSSIKYSSRYGSRAAIRIARIVKESFELGSGDDVRWFVMGDDDTVFFVENLVTVLGKYDHNQMYYIGGNSESVEQDVIHSYTTAFGGAGFAISYPLAKELVRILDGCLDRYADFYGSDQKISGCLSEIGVPITKELGFHQFDFVGNPYGLLAAHPLAPLVSLHHLDYVEPMFPGMTRIDSLKRLINSYKADPSRSVQHSFCYDPTRRWSVSVSWGYTVQVYPSLVTAKELETAFLTFQTWRSRIHEPFTFNTRFMSPDPCERPVVFFLDRVENNGRGSVLTGYKKFEKDLPQDCDRPDYNPILALDSVNVTSATLNPQIWDMAPRRQCCEIISKPRSDEEETLSYLEVKIRSCSQFEAVTPP